MAARKTIEVEKILAHANAELRGDYGSEEYRNGVIQMLEMVLHASGNYGGFKFLSSDNLNNPKNKPGINVNPKDRCDYNFDNTDPSRREYF